MMTRWFVITPEYERYPGSYYSFEPEPPEYGCDVVEVEAETKRKALVEGVRELRRSRSDWLRDQVGDNKSPFTGLKVEAA